MSQVYHHPKIGDIRLLPNTRCRGIKYSISSKGALISFNPLFADRVLPLPADKEEWFLRHKERIGRQANKYMYDADSRLQTTAFEIRFVEEVRLKDSLSAVLSTSGVLSIRYPSGFCFELPNRQQAIRNIIRQFWLRRRNVFSPKNCDFWPLVTASNILRYVSIRHARGGEVAAPKAIYLLVHICSFCPKILSILSVSTSFAIPER